MHDPVSRRSFRSIPLACLARAHVTRSQTFAATTEHNTPWSSCRSPLARTTFVFRGRGVLFCLPRTTLTVVAPFALPVQSSAVAPRSPTKTAP